MNYTNLKKIKKASYICLSLLSIENSSARLTKEELLEEIEEYPVKGGKILVPIPKTNFLDDLANSLEKQVKLLFDYTQQDDENEEDRKKPPQDKGETKENLKRNIKLLFEDSQQELVKSTLHIWRFSFDAFGEIKSDYQDYFG